MSPISTWESSETDKWRQRAEQAEATVERLKKMAGCPHYSASGIDTTPIDNPMKVWRCDECGFEYVEIWEPELGLRYNEGVLAERGGAK